MSIRNKYTLVLLIATLILMATACAQPSVVEREVVVTKEVEKEVLVEPDYVTLRTNWLFSGIHAWVFYGREKGFFRDENIVVDIREGNGSGNVVRTVINKSDDFALVSNQPPMISISQGSPIKFIYTWIGGFPWGYMCRKEANVQEAKDLEGKIIVSSPGNAGLDAHPVFVDRADLDPDKMQDLTLVDAGAMVSTVLAGKADCELGGMADHVPLWVAEGVEPSIVRMDDYGVGGPATAVITHQDTIDSNPDLVQRMVRVLHKSQMACAEDVDGCVEALLLAHPQMDFDTQKLALEMSIKDWLGPNQECVGQFVKENWQAGYELLKAAPESAIEGDQPIEEFYTEEFVPPCP